MDNCIEGPLANRTPKGYSMAKRGGKHVYLHRVAFQEAYGYLPAVVRHKCDNPPCINPEHLEGGTHVDNMRDMVERGRSSRGEKHGLATLSDEQAEEIRQSGDKYQVIADRYGIHYQTVYKIKKGKLRAHG